MKPVLKKVRAERIVFFSSHLKPHFTINYNHNKKSFSWFSERYSLTRPLNIKRKLMIMPMKTCRGEQNRACFYKEEKIIF